MAHVGVISYRGKGTIIIRGLSFQTGVIMRPLKHSTHGTTFFALKLHPNIVFLFFLRPSCN